MTNSDAMRNVGGGLLNKSQTRASQMGQGGLRIEPGGRKASFLTPFCKSVQCDAMTWLQWANHSKHKRTVVIEHGKAVLCSNIHQWARYMKKSKRVSLANMKIRSKTNAVDYYKGKTANEIASMIKKQSNFMKTEEWFVLKAQTIARYGCIFMKCKKTINSWMGINVDHIKPRKYYPHLQNDPENLQVLCANCNKEKGNGDADYR